MNGAYYKIPKSNSTRPAFFLWHPKEVLVILIVGVINFFLIAKQYEGTDGFFNAIIIIPSVFAALIMIIPEYNIRLTSLIYKYIYYFLLLPKKYKYKKSNHGEILKYSLFRKINFTKKDLNSVS